MSLPSPPDALPFGANNSGKCVNMVVIAVAGPMAKCGTLDALVGSVWTTRQQLRAEQDQYRLFVCPALDPMRQPFMSRSRN